MYLITRSRSMKMPRVSSAIHSSPPGLAASTSIRVGTRRMGGIANRLNWMPSNSYSPVGAPSQRAPSDVCAMLRMSSGAPSAARQLVWV